MKKNTVKTIGIILAAAILLLGAILPWSRLQEGKKALSTEIFQNIAHLQSALESKTWEQMILEEDTQRTLSVLSAEISLLDQCYRGSSLSKRVNGSCLAELLDSTQRLIWVLREEDSDKQQALALLEKLKPYYHAAVYEKTGAMREITHLRNGAAALAEQTKQPEFRALQQEITAFWNAN